MAKPILLEITKDDAAEELGRKVQAAPAKHGEAVLASFEVLQALHDEGVLELLRGMLGGGQKTLEIAVAAANTPEAIRGIRNLIVMTKVLGAIEPQLLEKFAQAVPAALVAVAKAEGAEPPGFWGMMKIFRSRNLRRGLAVVNNLLEAWGKNFNPEDTHA